MEELTSFLNSNFFNSLVGFIGIGFGVWQYKRATNIKKVVNDKVRGLYNDSKKILEFAFFPILFPDTTYFFIDVLLAFIRSNDIDLLS